MPFSGPDQVGVSGALAQMFFDVAGQAAFSHFAVTEEALATRLMSRGHGIFFFFWCAGSHRVRRVSYSRYFAAGPAVGQSRRLRALIRLRLSNTLAVSSPPAAAPPTPAVLTSAPVRYRPGMGVAGRSSGSRKRAGVWARP